MGEAEFRSLARGGILTSLRCHEVRTDDSDLAIHCEVRVLVSNSYRRRANHRFCSDRGCRIAGHYDRDFHNRRDATGNASDVEERRTGK